MNKNKKNRRINIAGWVIILLTLIIVVEFASYLLLVNAKNKNGRFFAFDVSRYIASIKDKHLTSFVSETSPYSPHPILGWQRQPNSIHNVFNGTVVTTNSIGARFIPNMPKTRPLISAYGDSFTEAVEVNDSEAWLALLAHNTKTNILNFGVSGYGPDQALLLSENKIREGHVTPFVFLCIIRENMNRLMNIFRPYYTYPVIDWAVGFKPIFTKENKNYKLLDLVPDDMTDKKLMIEYALAAQNYDLFWQQRTEKLMFPFTYNLTHYFKNHGLKAKTVPWPGSTQDAWNKLDYILKRFTRNALLENFTPVFVLLPANKSNLIAAKNNNRPVAKFVVKQQYANLIFIDVEYELNQLKGFKADKMIEIHHYSKYGNQAVAQVLRKKTQQLLMSFHAPQN